MKEGPWMVLRADASSTIGTGHVMRCLALAQAWREDGGRVLLISSGITPPLAARYSAEETEIVSWSDVERPSKDAAMTAAVAKEREAACLVFDGYHFGPEAQRAARDAGVRTLFIDDFGHAGAYEADLVLDQNACPWAEVYARRDPRSELLLGERFILLRREFRRWAGRRPPFSSSADRVLVTMGGADSSGATLRAVRALRQCRAPIQVRAVVGGNCPDAEALAREAREAGSAIRVEHDLTDMSEPIAWAHAALAAGGTTCWELAFMGVPFAAVSLAKNQVPVARCLVDKGIAEDLGWHENVSEDVLAGAVERLLGPASRREEMSRRGKALVDGHGVWRVLMRARGEKLWLRPADPGDAELLWKWANDEDVRRWSFSQDAIPWETHVEWFSRRLSSDENRIYIGFDGEDAPVGQVRFDAREGRTDIGITVDNKRRGAGFGGLLLAQALRRASVDGWAKEFHAAVKADNAGSRSLFERTGFRAVERGKVNGQDMIHYVRTG